MAAGELSKDDFEALASYRYAMRRFQHFSELAARGAGITPQQYLLMLAIKGYPGRDHANIGELAERLQLDHHSTVGLVDRTEKRKLVQRNQNPDDRRQVNVTLTPEGEQLVRKLAGVHREELKRMHEDLRPPGFSR